jgi:hypothetical protein
LGSGIPCRSRARGVAPAPRRNHSTAIRAASVPWDEPGAACANWAMALWAFRVLLLRCGGGCACVYIATRAAIRLLPLSLPPLSWAAARAPAPGLRPHAKTKILTRKPPPRLLRCPAIKRPRVLRSLLIVVSVRLRSVSGSTPRPGVEASHGSYRSNAISRARRSYTKLKTTTASLRHLLPRLQNVPCCVVRWTTEAPTSRRHANG